MVALEEENEIIMKTRKKRLFRKAKSSLFIKVVILGLEFLELAKSKELWIYMNESASNKK